jgi:hypothetical protein
MADFKPVDGGIQINGKFHSNDELNDFAKKCRENPPKLHFEFEDMEENHINTMLTNIKRTNRKRFWIGILGGIIGGVVSGLIVSFLVFLLTKSPN